MRVVEGAQIFRLGRSRETDDSRLDGEVRLAQTTALYKNLAWGWQSAVLLGWC